ncbi:hypothetical protein AAVH_28856 [Aphelenchoides avenae]|nr:hypothetical protein AAVH_28856 [Aphelenchus avenae]
MYRQALKRPNNAPVSLNPKRGSQAVIRQGPPGEDTESFTHPAEYTVIYITNDNATAVRNAPHPTAPPFIWLNNFTLVEFVGTDGFSQLLQFEVNRAAYGDKFWLLVIGEQNCGQKDIWTRVKGQPQVVFPPNGKPTPHGTALRVRQMADQLAQRSTRLAFVAGKTSNNRFLVADPMTPRRYAKVPLSKVIYSKDNARPPTMNTLIRVQYATLQHVEVTTDNAMVVPMQLGYSFPYRMNRVDEERHQLISAQTITGSEFARLRDNRWFDATKPLESQLRFYLDSILAAITLVHTNRVQDTDSRCITAVPAWDLTEDGHIRLTFEAQYENEKALAKVKQQFKADGRATIRPEVMPRKQPASVSIGNVRTPSSTSIVVEVIVDAAAMEAHWEMTPDQLHNVPFTLSVPVGKVAPPSFREALEKEHLINWIMNIDMRDTSWAAKGDMLRTIMNYPVLENPAPKLSLGRPLIPSKRGFTLNQGQSDAVHRMMYEQRRSPQSS